ncbi:hypothetical protein SAMN05444337_1678 [Flavobacterium haoranii]|uniref:Uncharacterized protein n=1 Tax=Flavobacterium haoranii TaxID=683124 RepID=A0A1M6HX67_9FLAO|nr:hypothetical protein SAMN05444337_1678 [Flavobacterium haoranii]
MIKSQSKYLSNSNAQIISSCGISTIVTTTVTTTTPFGV